MPSSDLNGLIPIVPTPFTPAGDVDFPALERILRYLLDVGVHGVAVLGMASEVITLTDAERVQIIEHATGVVQQRVPVIAGCSHISPQAVSSLAGQASAAGADVLMVMPPSMGDPDPDALLSYFLAAAEASDAAVMIQDNPGWHGVTIPIQVYEQSSQHPNVQYAKVETKHPPTTMTAVSAAVGGRLKLLGGQAGIWLPEEMRRGIVGTMPAAIMPQAYLAIWQLWQSGRTEDAEAVFDHYHPLIRVTSTARLGIPMSKVILAQAGVLETTTVRAPFPTLQEDDLADLNAVMDRLHIAQLMRGTRPVWTP